MDEYYLHADLIVREGDAGRFERLAGSFIQRGAFKRLKKTLDYQLVLAARTAEAFSFTGYQVYEPGRPRTSIRELRIRETPERVFRYVNVWRVPQLADLALAEVRNRSAADPDYIEIASLFVREIQNITCRVKYQQQAATPARTQENVLRVTRQFDPKELGTYAQAVIPGVLPALEDAGWHLLGLLQNVTGPLNTVTEFWQTSSHNAGQQSASDAVRQIKSNLLANTVHQFTDLPVLDVGEPLIRASFDPGLVGMEGPAS